MIERYANEARRAAAGETCAPDDGRFGAANYEAGDLADLPGAAVSASLGCGNPFALAELEEGEVVLDLGSGGGIDVLLSARRVGASGKAYGLDAIPEMIALARENAAAAGVDNVEFLQGRLEAIPLPADEVDVVISNCVVNLVPDKAAAFAELVRVLRPGGRIAISDIVVEDGAASASGPCVDGALSEATYIGELLGAGLRGVSVERTHAVGERAHGAAVRAERPLAVRAGVAVRRMRPLDWPRVREIYLAGIATGNATFETDAPSWEAWDACHLAALRFVAVDDVDRAIGWVAASPVSDRCVYGGVVEHAVYVDPAAQRSGVGSLLLQVLLEAADTSGIWTVQSGIFPENEASIALHERCGFRVVGRRERLGMHAGRWRDVVLVERRSPTVN